MRLAIANLIQKIHLLVVLLAVTGWGIFDGLWLRLYGLSLIVILIQWLLFENRCVLTIWEDLLRHGHSPKELRVENTFIGRTVQKITGKTPSFTLLNTVTYGLLILAIIATFYRISRGA